MCFHRPGLYASYFGIDTDNNFAIGGWSAGAALGNMKVGTIYANNWFSSYGNTGWYNETHGGGIYMQDTTWVRVYNNKQFYSQNLIQSDTDIRAPIFNDSNDTSYYMDPNTNVPLYGTRLRSGILFGPNYSWGAYLLVGGNGKASGYQDNASVASVASTDGSLHLGAGSGKIMYLNYYDGDAVYFCNGASGHVGTINNSGYAYFPIYYDWNNTGYYVDPSSTTQLSYVLADNWFRPQGATGLYFQTYGHGVWPPEGSGNPYGNITTYGTGRNGWAGWGLGDRFCLMHDHQNGGNTLGMHENNYGWVWRWIADSYFTVDRGYSIFANSARAPIFYDSNDTNYYCDPNATTRLNNLIITGTVSGIPTGGGITSINISGAGLSSNTLTSNGTLSLFGTLSLANGGTGSSLGNGSAGQVLTSNGGGGSYWNTPSGGGIATPVSKANGGTGSSLGYGSVGEVLVSNGSSGSYWGSAVKPTTITSGNSQYNITLKTFDVSGSGSSYGIGLSVYNEDTGTRGFLVARQAMSIGSSTSMTYSGATHTWFVDQFQRMVLSGNALYPFDPVKYPINLGTTNYRWATAWVATGVWGSSDLREKTDIENSNLGLEFILKLRPVSYKWIKNKQNISAGITEATNYGFIAQEIGEIFGDQSFGGYAYDKDSDSYGLKYDQFIAPLVKAIQEQQQIINELKNDIEILKNK